MDNWQATPLVGVPLNPAYAPPRRPLRETIWPDPTRTRECNLRISVSAVFTGG